MPDTKISALANIGTLHSDDLLVDVDVHDTSMAASGTDKNLTVNQLIGGATSGQLLYCNSSGVPVGAVAILRGANTQLNLAEIATPGTQVSGDRWTDSTQHCEAGFDGSATSADCVNYFRTGLIFSQVTNVTASSTGSSSLVSATSAIGTVSLPAGYLNVVGRTLRVRARGYYSSVSSPGTAYMFLKLGSNTVLTGAGHTLTASQTNAEWLIDCDFTVKAIGSSGKIDGGGFLSLVSSGTAVWVAALTNGSTPGTLAPTTQVAIDLTAVYALDLQVNLNTSGNSFTLTNLTVEVLA